MKVQCGKPNFSFLMMIDYELSDTDMNNKQIKILKENLTPSQLMQIPGTEEQSKSHLWLSERWRRFNCIKVFGSM